MLGNGRCDAVFKRHRIPAKSLEGIFEEKTKPSDTAKYYQGFFTDLYKEGLEKEVEFSSGIRERVGETYKYNLTVLSFGIRVYNYTYDTGTSSGQAILSWVLTAASATDFSFTASVKQYESVAGGELLGFYKMLLRPGEASVLRSETFKLSFSGSLDEMMQGRRAFKVVFSYPPEENGYSVGWYKAKMIYFNLSGGWHVYILRPSD